MEPKQLILPGALVSATPKRFEGCYIDGGKTYTDVLSLKTGDKVIPLKGHYQPKLGDYVIGIVAEERFSGYEVNLNSPFPASLSARDVRESFVIGDIISARVRMVDEVHSSQLVEPRKFYGGRLIEVESVKVPRVIGRNGSMLALIKEYTGTDLFVGKNGRIYVKGGDVALAVLAVLKISSEAHTSGLTERVKSMLEEQSKKSFPSGGTSKAPDSGAQV